MRFDYAFGRYALFNGTIRLTVEASTDGGSTWTSLWNAKEDLENESGYTQSGTCELAIPEEFCTADVQFAFRFYKTAYTGGDRRRWTNVSLTVPDGAGETGHTCGLRPRKVARLRPPATLWLQTAQARPLP